MMSVGFRSWPVALLFVVVAGCGPTAQEEARRQGEEQRAIRRALLDQLVSLGANVSEGSNRVDVRLTRVGVATVSDVLATMAQFEHPPAWGLVLSGCELDEAESEALGRLGTFENLDLSRTTITGEQLRHLTAAGRIRKLSLSGADLGTDGLAHVASIDGLESLVLVGCEVGDAEIAALKGPTLARLNLNQTEVTSAGIVDLLGRLVHVKELHLADTEVDDAIVPEVAKCTFLEILDLSRTGVTTTSGFDGLKNLEQLLLTETGVVDDQLAALGEIARLRTLDLAGTGITDDGLEHLRRLSVLDTLVLDDTRVGDAGLAHLHRNRKLSYVPVRRTNVTPAGVAALEKEVPGVTVKTE